MRQLVNKILKYFNYLHIDEVNEVLTGTVTPLRYEIDFQKKLVSSITETCTIREEYLIQVLMDIQRHQNVTGKGTGYVAKRVNQALLEVGESK